MRLSGTWLPPILVVSAFGPYLAGTVFRLEHVLIYGTLPFALAWLRARRETLHRSPELCQLWLAIAWVTLWTLVVTVVGEPHFDSLRKAISHAERYARPLAIIALTAAAAAYRPAADRRLTLLRCLRVMVVLLQANAALALLSVFVDLRPVLVAFWGPDSVVDGELFNPTYAGGRYTGVFTQPAEAGLAYTIGLFAWVFLARVRGAVSWVDVGGALLLVAGGILTVSKVMLFVGIPLALLWAWLSGVAASFFRLRALLVVGAFAAGVAMAGNRWLALDFLRWVVLGSGEPDRDTLADAVFRYSGGRFGGEGSLLLTQAMRVLEEAPLWGLGFGSFVNLDSAYIEFFAQGGLVGLLVYVFVLLSMLWTAVRLVASRSGAGVLLLCLALVTWVAGVGAPVITMNRFATLFWVVVVLAYPVRDAPPAAAPEQSATDEAREPAAEGRVRECVPA